MSFLFIILFFAAVVGIFRPYRFIHNAKRWHYGVAAFAAFVLVGVFAPEGEKAETDNAAKSAAISDEMKSAEDNDTADPPKVDTVWSYDEERDEMRGSTRKFAEVESENSVDLDFPYGEQKGILTVRQDPQYGLDVMFRVRSGQILCHGFGDSYINAKFDDGPIRRFNCNSASDGTSEVAFINDSRTFLKTLKLSKRTVIEAEFYQNGRVQYVFDTTGLKWE